jgi:hypothetical protein
LGAEAIEMGVIPSLARHALTRRSGGSVDEITPLIAVFDRTAVMLTGYVANGLYSLSAILMTGLTWRLVPAWVWAPGLAVGLCGLALSAASLAGWIDGMMWSTALLIPCIVVWQTAVAIHAGKEAGYRAGAETEAAS